jgi:hypothetical protein
VFRVRYGFLVMADGRFKSSCPRKGRRCKVRVQSSALSVCNSGFRVWGLGEMFIFEDFGFRV